MAEVLIIMRDIFMHIAIKYVSVFLWTKTSRVGRSEAMFK